MTQVKLVKRSISKKEALEGFNSLLEAYKIANYDVLNKRAFYGIIANDLNNIILYMNNEDAYLRWIWTYPDGETLEEAMDDFGTKKELGDLFLTFIRLYNCYREDGLYFPRKDLSVVDSVIKNCKSIDTIFNYIDIEVF